MLITPVSFHHYVAALINDDNPVIWSHLLISIRRYQASGIGIYHALFWQLIFLALLAHTAPFYGFSKSVNEVQNIRRNSSMCLFLWSSLTVISCGTTLLSRRQIKGSGRKYIIDSAAQWTRTMHRDPHWWKWNWAEYIIALILPSAD